MNLSASHTLANALRSALWMVNLYSNTNENGPTLRDLKIAIGRAIVELEAHATTEYKAAHRPEAADQRSDPIGTARLSRNKNQPRHKSCARMFAYDQQ